MVALAEATEGTICQSCGLPMDSEDWPEESERGDFCHYCMVHDEFVADRADVKHRLTEQIAGDTGKSRQEAEAAAEETMSKLKRWK
jgi:hypothetical protein